MIRSGISQIGGKFRSLKQLLPLIPRHDFFQSLFAGACWVELNKPRAKFECFNDINSEFINYYKVIQTKPQEFDKKKKSIFGLVAEFLFKEIMTGSIRPKTDVERAIYFYYINKLGFGGSTYTEPQENKKILKLKETLAYVYKFAYEKGFQAKLEEEAFKEEEMKNIVKKTFEMGFHNGFYSNTNNSEIEFLKSIEIPNLKEKIENGKEEVEITIPPDNFNSSSNVKGFRGLILPSSCKKKSIEETKARYRGIMPKNDITYLQKRKTGNFKGLMPKTTRPYTNNDCGLLTPLDEEFVDRITPLDENFHDNIENECIERSRYVNFLCKDFRNAYNLFLRGFHERKGLSHQCLIYCDPPYPDNEEDMTSEYYLHSFSRSDHLDLIELLLESPFNVLLSIGGYCQYYLDVFNENDWFIKEIETSYSTSANNQGKKLEYAIMNYDINKLPEMQFDSDQKTLMSYS